MSAPLIQLSEVSLGFGKHDIFKNIDLVLNKGERTCLVGRNGSGKSTLLKLIAGKIVPDAGHVAVQKGIQVSLMEQDPDAALHLLLSADRIVGDAEGTAAHELRAALADDIAALQAVSAPDVQGLYLEISAQIRQVSALERKLPAYQAPMARTEAPPAAEGFLAEIAALARSAFGRLGQLLDFRRGGVEIKPVLPPEQQYYLRQNLILKLQIAQIQAGYTLDREELLRRAMGKKKAEVMQQFKSGELHLLVATTVIEVGVDVPNASLMVMANAERLGLSQLHQLRGRVGRGAQDSYCVLLYHPPLGAVARERLEIMRQTNDGFVIAQKDLEIRGPGEVLGTRQTGEVQFRLADLIRDQHWIEPVQKAADHLIAEKSEHIQPLIQRWIGEKQNYSAV